MLFLKRGPLRCAGLSLFQRWAFFSPHWVAGNLAQVFYSVATGLAWFSISLFPPVPPLDALFLPIIFFVTICTADWWFQRGVVLPVLKQAHNLFNAFIALPTALATLVAPRRQMRWKITSSVTSEGRQVCWRILAPAAFLIASILGGILFTMTNGSSPDRTPFFAVALLFWTAWQLITLTLVALASIERPRHPDEETILVDWPAVVHSSGQTWRGTATLVSLSQISLSVRDGESDGLDGRSGLIDLADIGRIAAHFSREVSSDLLRAKFRFFEGSSRKRLIGAIYRNAAHFVADRDPLMLILRRLIAPHTPFGSDESVRVRALVAGRGH